MGGNNDFFENFERNKYLKKLPSMQRVKKIQRHQEVLIELWVNPLSDRNTFGHI